MEIRRTDLKCDVLIVGGGVGGLSCAVSLKERLPEADVLIIEKQTAGYSGKANRGGGVLQYFDPKRVTPEQFLAFHVTQVGGGIGDQELMLRYVGMNSEMLEKLESWGVSIPREADGSFHVMPTGPMTAITCVDLDITLRIRRRAEKLGVRILDKTVLAELLTDGDAVSGAVAYSLLNGDISVISAGRVVLATGSQNYRFASMWSSGRGDGIAAAWRAGAKLRNVEFGNFAQLVKAHSHSEVVFGENYMHNALNENVTRHFRSHRESDINSNAIQEWRTQMLAGNGPIHLDYGDEPEESLEKLWPRPYGAKFNQLNHASADAADGESMEVVPMFIGEQSPIYVGHDMQTSVNGLYAIGDCSYCGSGAPGAVPAPPGRNRGSGILNALFAALCCAEGIEQAGTPAAKAPEEAQIEAGLKALFAPLERESGATAKEVIALVQKAMVPVENSVLMTEERMLAALKLVEEAKALAATLKANDTHELLSCHEAEAMVLSAELHYRAALMRKESRGWFLREDYPEMDNLNWRKRIVVQKQGDGMNFTTEDIPLDKCPIFPKGNDPVPITEEERNSPLYQYYAREMVAPDPSRYAEVSAPVDGELALKPQEMNRLFDDGYLPIERGYCHLPDGTATLANLTPMPGVTVEMFDWWFAWHGLEPMRYKLWDHDDHYSCLTRNPEISRNERLSMKERYWNTIHDVVEDTGLGPEKIAINFRDPADVGFDPEKLKAFDGTIVCAGNEQNPVFMCHFLRPVEGGCELRTRFWMGYSIIGGKPVKVIPDGTEFPIEAAMGLLMHNIKEFTNLAAILPEIYAEFHDRF